MEVVIGVKDKVLEEGPKQDAPTIDQLAQSPEKSSTDHLWNITFYSLKKMFDFKHPSTL